jgi:tryptophanyl-tRNA synthetase
LIDGQIKDYRERYNELMANPAQIEAALQIGAEKARAEAQPLMKKLREAVGIRPLG